MIEIRQKAFYINQEENIVECIIVECNILKNLLDDYKDSLVIHNKRTKSYNNKITKYEKMLEETK